jgi:hypothetical protein
MLQKDQKHEVESVGVDFGYFHNIDFIRCRNDFMAQPSEYGAFEFEIWMRQEKWAGGDHNENLA